MGYITSEKLTQEFRPVWGVPPIGGEGVGGWINHCNAPRSRLYSTGMSSFTQTYPMKLILSFIRLMHFLKVVFSFNEQFVMSFS